MNESQNIDLLWMLLCAMLVFTMQAGFMCLEAGLTRTKNSINVAIKNISDFGVSAASFWAVGFAVMFGPSLGQMVGAGEFFVTSLSTNDSVFFFFQLMFCGTAVSIISGAIAERTKFVAYLLIAVITAGVLYPIIGHWAWGGLVRNEVTGWLAQLGFVDFAGSTVVHSVGGWVALAAVLVVGPRDGRFPKDGEPRRFNGSNLPLAVLGTMVLWFGWFGFNGGSARGFEPAVPGILLNTLVGATFGMIATVVLDLLRKKRVDVFSVMIGTLGGLVAVTANAHATPVYAACFIGAVGGIVVALVDRLMERLQIDDAVGAIPVHLGAGVWGTLAVALFGEPALLGTGLSAGQQLLVQLIGVLSIGAFVFGGSYFALRGIDRFWRLRVSAADELVGLNVAEHNANTDLRELLTLMSEQAASMDLSRRVTQDPFNEIGQIGIHYNNLLYNLERATNQSETLLTSVLPKQVSSRLRNGERVADNYNEVSVLFADITGFTQLTQNLLARRLIEMLDKVFARFDALADRYHVEKIKTIGDNYMAVAGLWNSERDHAQDAADMSLGMHEAIMRFNREEFGNDENRYLSLRIGIHSGPVVAGVIGTRRFVYDLWGDTVNIASRMESHGVPGETQLSETTYDLIQKNYNFQARGTIEIKGKGPMRTYLLKDRYVAAA
jgi:ammonium transporter, Amt family